MDFAFLSPLAFKLLYALPLLFIPYLLRERNKRMIVPALFLYQGLPATARRRLWGRPHLTPLFFLQLLLLLLLIIAAARPFLPRYAGKVAIVIDTSASMQAQTAATKDNMFALAKRQAADEIAALSAEETVSLFTSAPIPMLVSTSPEMPSPRQLLASLTVTATPDPGDTVLAAFFSQLVQEHGFQRVVFFTDRPLAKPLGVGTLVVRTLASPRPNLSISAVRLYRSPFAPDDIEATVALRGPTDRVKGRVEILNADTGQQLATQPLPKNNKSTVAFPRLPLASTYRIHFAVEDGLAVDNDAYAVLPTLSTVPVLVVSPAANVVKSVGQIPNLAVTFMRPEEYTPEQAMRFPLVLFHLTAPDMLPATNAAFLLPPEGNRLFPLGKGATRPRMTQWSADHRLTAYVTFSLLTPSYGQALLPISWCKSVINGTVGALVLAGEHEGRRYAALGFDLFPYLGKQNLPASILTLNLLGWLADQTGQQANIQTGTVLQIGGLTTTVYQPNGQIVAVENGAVRLTQQGVYTLSDHGVVRKIAVNLNDGEESHLGRPLHIPEIAPAVPVAPEKTDQPLWPWILYGVLFLLLVDWHFGQVGKMRSSESGTVQSWG
ncbi:MAG: hypothetical protein EXR78_02930 [Deltaproteobacteria bacterium]|nr:hypothetical protein [Deltaproteobacteria bacterium]